MKKTILKIWIILFLFFTSVSFAQAADYYLDANTGNDETGDGSEELPWQTLVKAQANVYAGDNVYLNSGDYGAYTESNIPRTNYVTYQAMEGADVHFDHISISNDVLTDNYLRFIRINIKPDWVDPCASGEMGCNDPQYAESTQSTYTKTAFPLSLSKAKFVEVNNSVLEGQSRHLTSAAAYMTSSENITISGCDVKNTTHGLRFIGTGANNVAYGNHIHHIAGTGINTVGVGYVNMLYENNHIHDGIYLESEDYAPRADGANVHGSGISVRDGNTTIRGNIIHDTGTSSGIMFYEDDAGNDYVNENILMENNLIYDLRNVYVLRMYEVGPNVVIRNNTLIANSRYEVNDGYAQYRTAFALHAVDEQNGPAAVKVYNNIMIGVTNIASPYVIEEDNNIVWSTYGSGDYACTGDPEIGPNTYVYTCTYANRSSAPLYDLFSNDPNMTFLTPHGLTLDFSIAKTSMAYNFGNVENQPSKSLGFLDSNNEFVIDNGLRRSTFLHSAGAYEYVARYRADVNNSSGINTADALLTLRNSLGLDMAGTTWQVGEDTGDVNCNESSNSADALLILRYSLGLGMEETEWCDVI